MYNENMAVSKAWILSNRPDLIKLNYSTIGWDYDNRALEKNELLSVLDVDSTYMDNYLGNQLVPIKHIVGSRIFTIGKEMYFTQPVGSSSSSYTQNIVKEFNYTIKIALNYSQQQIKDILLDETDKSNYIFCNSENYKSLSSVKIKHKVTPAHSSNATYVGIGPIDNINIVTDLNDYPSTVYGTGGILRWSDNTIVPEDYIVNIPPLDINGDHTPRIIYEKEMKIGVYNPVKTPQSKRGYSVKNVGLELRNTASKVISIYIYRLTGNNTLSYYRNPYGIVQMGLGLEHI